MEITHIQIEFNYLILKQINVLNLSLFHFTIKFEGILI